MSKPSIIIENYKEKLSQKWFKISYSQLTPFGKQEVDWDAECVFEDL
tara:strand:- start:1596 stop:1736 length:141 start_codon:yes stop_codon:yes gene_type:complete